MPLRNRVTPFGEIVAVPERGQLMGNRGILHGDERNLVRQWQVRRWITCLLQHKGIRRTVMRPHSYTELFFLDEATAFAAGHRPCAECRRADYKRFQSLWGRSIGLPSDADSMDDRLHAERLDHRSKRTHRGGVATLPDGAFVAIEGAPYLVRGSELLLWTPGGYVRRIARPSEAEVEVLTPPSILAIFRTGYAPVLHPSA